MRRLVAIFAFVTVFSAHSILAHPAPPAQNAEARQTTDTVVLAGKSPILNKAEGKEYPFRWIQVRARARSMEACSEPGGTPSASRLSQLINLPMTSIQCIHS